MVDLSITAGSVVKGTGAVEEQGIAGATITAGQVVYKDSADTKFKLADADDATAAVRVPRGIALNGASDGQPLRIQRDGQITIGATMTAGLAYYLSDTPGGIAPYADLGSGDQVVLIGVAISTTVLQLKLLDSGVEL